DCRRMLNEITKGEVEFSPRLIESVDKRQMIVRLLHNLKSSYVRRGDDAGALGAVERLLILEPHDLTQTRDRGLLLYRMQRYAPALESLRAYLDQVGDAVDREDIERTVAALKQQLTTLN